MDTTERSCELECAKITEGVRRLVGDLEYAIHKDEDAEASACEIRNQTAFASRIGSGDT